MAPELAPVEAAAPAPSAEPPTPAVGLVFDDGSVVELRPDDARVPAFRRAAESLLTRSVREPAT